MLQKTLFSVAQETSYFDDICSSLGVDHSPGWPDRFGKAFSAWVEGKLTKPVRTLSLFSGMGGLDIAFHDAGFNITQMVEIEKKFTSTLLRNTGAAGRYLGNGEVHCIDIRQFVPAVGSKFDFIIGGPPCQTFSAAARRASGVSGMNDERGTLFQEYVRLLSTVKPKGFLFENVYGITGANGGRAWELIQEGFSNAGYKVSWRILDAADYGVPQHRERMFIVGLRDGSSFKFPQPTHGPDCGGSRPYFSAANAIEGVILDGAEQSSRVTGRYEQLLEQVPPGLNYSYFTEKMGHPNPIFAWRSKFSDFLYKANPDCPIRTLKAQGGQFTGPFHWDSRPFTITELKRLQTVPDNFEIVGKRGTAVHQIGNSVPPQVARILAIAVLDQVFGLTPPERINYLSENESLGFRSRKRSKTTSYRTTASNAISTLEVTTNGKSHNSKSRTRILTDKFHWKEGNGEGAISVQFKALKDNWTIGVAIKQITRKAAAFVLHIAPVSGQWGLPVSCVRLRSDEFSPKLFTSLWKAFEEEMKERHLKADLVQLCNYYQYDPSFSVTAEFTSPPPSLAWNSVKKVCEGVGVRATLPLRDLSELWEVPKKDVLQVAQFLRQLGYEVRNSGTNPEIPKGHFLVPYSFPTLNPRSVQLNKHLV